MFAFAGILDRDETRCRTAKPASIEKHRSLSRRPAWANLFRQGGSRTGSTAVEFAFVAPVFFTLVFGLIEVSRMLMVQQALTSAAREGCRTAAMATTINDADVEAAVRSYLQPAMHHASDANVVRVSCPTGLAAAASGSELNVQVEVDYSDVSWVSVGYLGLNPTISASQTGRRE